MLIPAHSNSTCYERSRLVLEMKLKLVVIFLVITQLCKSGMTVVLHTYLGR